MGAGEQLDGRFDLGPGGGARPSERRTAPRAISGLTPMASSVAFGVCSPAWQAEPVDAAS
jgi:hypothetical protein